MVKITLQPEYGYVLMTAITLAFECHFIGFIMGGRGRALHFNEAHMNRYFGKEHKEAFGENSVPSK